MRRALRVHASAHSQPSRPRCRTLLPSVYVACPPYVQLHPCSCRTGPVGVPAFGHAHRWQLVRLNCHCSLLFATRCGAPHLAHHLDPLAPSGHTAAAKSMFPSSPAPCRWRASSKSPSCFRSCPRAAALLSARPLPTRWQTWSRSQVGSAHMHVYRRALRDTWHLHVHSSTTPTPAHTSDMHMRISDLCHACPVRNPLSG